MKNIVVFLILLVAASSNVSAQSITIGTAPGTAFCTGETVVIPYTATGSYTSKNSFIVQISDQDGSFEKFFYNAGEVRTPNSGSVTVVIPSLTASPNYRFRVISSDPYVVSSNTSPAIGLGPQPDLYIGLGGSSRIKFGMVGEAVTFNSSAVNTSVHWDFGVDANPRFSSEKDPVVVFESPGFKSITFTASSFGGCTQSQTFADRSVYVGTCMPSIPKDAMVDSVSNFYGHGFSDLWIVPGGYLDIAMDWPIIYAEAGSTINRTWYGIYYLKAGTAVGSARDGVVIYEDGVGLGNSELKMSFKCPNLEFDYSDAPPYKIKPASVSRVSGSTIQVYPNPTTDRLWVEHKDNIIREISLRNTLGAEQLFARPEGLGKTSIDVSKLASGLYFLDLITDRGIETHKIVVR